MLVCVYVYGTLNLKLLVHDYMIDVLPTLTTFNKYYYFVTFFPRYMFPALLRNEHNKNEVEMRTLLVCQLARATAILYFRKRKILFLPYYVTPSSKNAISTVQTPGSNFLLSPCSNLSSSSRCVRIPQILHVIVQFS